MYKKVGDFWGSSSILKPLLLYYLTLKIMMANKFTSINRVVKRKFLVHFSLLSVIFILTLNNADAQITFMSDDENGAGLSSVDLIYFSVVKSGDNNKLKWTTATEYNNDFFAIEKSINGINYEIIGYKEAVGNSVQCSNYLLIDKDVTNVINYYRIKQVDNAGTTNILDELVIDSGALFIKKEVAMVTNLFGEEVDCRYRGEIIVTYIDGTSVRMIQ